MNFAEDEEDDKGDESKEQTDGWEHKGADLIISHVLSLKVRNPIKGGHAHQVIMFVWIILLVMFDNRYHSFYSFYDWGLEDC